MGLASKFGLAGLGATLASKAKAAIQVTADFITVAVDGQTSGFVPAAGANDGSIAFGDPGQVTLFLDENTAGNFIFADINGSVPFSGAITSISGNIDGINFENNNTMTTGFSYNDGTVNSVGDSLFFDVADDSPTDMAGLEIQDFGLLYLGTSNGVLTGQPTIAGSLETLNPSVVEDNYDDRQEVTFRLADTSGMATDFYEVVGFISVTDVQTTNVPEPSMTGFILGASVLAAAAIKRHGWKAQDHAPSNKIG